VTEPKQVSRRRTGLVLGVVGIAAVLVVGGVATLRGIMEPGVATSESLTFDVQAPRLTVDVGSGEVTVGRAAGSQVEVTRTVRGRGSAEPTLTETSTADGVTLAAECNGWSFGGCSVDYDVRVPDGFVLDLEASSGRLAAAGVQVDSATLQASSGDIDLADVRGPLVLESSSGEISGERLDTATFRARASSGDVTLDFATAPSAVDVEVSSGEVAVALPAGESYRVQADTSTGEATVSVPVDPAASSTVRVAASSGDVGVRIR
jgi:DUF4097 and DUF4098 domain-containing protein YvlB